MCLLPFTRQNSPRGFEVDANFPEVWKLKTVAGLPLCSLLTRPAVRVVVDADALYLHVLFGIELGLLVAGGGCLVLQGVPELWGAWEVRLGQDFEKPDSL